MKTKVFFENKNIRCRLVITKVTTRNLKNSPVQPVDFDEHHDFDNVSDLVNYCNEHHIKVPIGDCITVDTLD